MLIIVCQVFTAHQLKYLCDDFNLREKKKQYMLNKIAWQSLSAKKKKKSGGGGGVQ